MASEPQPRAAASDLETLPAAPPRLRRRRFPVLGFETRILLLALAVGAPGLLMALLLLGSSTWDPLLAIAAALVTVALWWFLALELRERVVRPIRTLANLLGAVRGGDFSLRARLPERSEQADALGQVMQEVNAVAEILRQQRLGAVEATALLHRVMEEVDVAVYAFDHHERLRLVNRAGARLLGGEQDASALLGRDAGSLGLAELLHGEQSRIVVHTFPGGTGRWDVRRSVFREQGLPHDLLVMTDLSQTLREEERQAWRRLLRVLGHELNNSLAPIRSMASTLAVLLEKQPEDWREDMRSGLEIIGGRSDALIRFMAAYSKLAKLPPPKREPLELSALIRRTAALERRLPVFVERGPQVTVHADADQLEQLLINLIRNAVDAALLTGGMVGVGWREAGPWVEVRVEDEGPGIANSENLFVPFYTTKPEGSGIGLALSLQIAEAHGGTLTLENRKEGRGCEALLRLPL